MRRELGWDGCLNVRDLGGIPLEQGGVTRFGSLIRSDNVRRLTDDGWHALAAHGVTRIVDLRWPEELAEDAPRDVDIDVVHVSLLGELDPNFADDIEDYIEADDPGGYWASAYASILEEYRQNFGVVLSAIADADDGAIVFHCAAGKDRTGLVAALLLRVAGASIEEVAHDYSLTYEMLGRGPRAWVEEAAADEREHRRRAFMQHTPAEAMEGALAHIDERYGDVEAYLRAAGLDDRRIARLKDRLAPA